MVRARLLAVALAALLALLATAVPAALASSAPAGADVLAVEDPEGEEEERPPPGPDPDYEDNPFMPPEYEVPWTYGLGIALTAVGVLAIIGTALGYWALVGRDRDEEPSRR
jgi:hypothetical protein